jgi:hypothetical protein
MAALQVVCPNCGRITSLDIGFLDGQPWTQVSPGCGDCAQAGVRPRSLYRYVIIDVIPEGME